MEKLISVIGLTSSGKSSLGIELARAFNGEIVSADSRQVYKGLDWCSGKVTSEELAMVKHHLIDICELGNQFSLFDFQKLAYSAIDDIISRGKTPFMVGGTGLYSRSVVEGYNLTEDKPDAVLREKLSTLSLDELIDICKQKNIDISGEQTCRRLIRLIEKSSKQAENAPKYDVLQIGIKWDREEIYERIRQRLEMRMPNMIREIEGLVASGVDKDFLITLGLEAKYVLMYLENKFSSYEEFFEELFKEERHFAKRQNTWYNKEKSVIWIDGNSNVLEKAKEIVSDFLNK